MTGKIFNIQRFSIYDGEGIRTAFFLKGCNLKCLWCHNPESQKSADELMLYRDKCTGCGKCKAYCTKAFTDECISCGKCSEVCFSGARVLCGETIDSDEIVRIALRDEKFYKSSGGGVTFSGGEPLLQTDFLCECLKKCKSVGINTALESAGAVSYDCFEKVLPYTDTVLYDIKAIDSTLHRKLTGASNELILENAKRLMNENVGLLFRMPVVPGYNISEVSRAAEFVYPFKLEILPYHNICLGKYNALGRNFDTKEAEIPSEELMRSFAKECENIIYENKI